MTQAKKEPLSVEQELREWEARQMEFEAQLQSGELDLSEDDQKHRRINLERARSLTKGRNDVTQAISRPEFRRVLWRILAIAGPNRLSPDITQPLVTAHNDGKRAVANEILLMLWDADPNVYAQMQREHASDMKTEHERRKKEQGEN